METQDQRTLKVLSAAFTAWNNAGSLRAARTRNKNFTYGRQLDDIVTLPDGTRATEREAIIASGKEPLTNNLMRQLVKTVVGKFREINAERSKNAITGELGRFYSDCDLAEIDARAMEEFLLSGMCVQKVDMCQHLNNWELGVKNVSPQRFFINAIASPDGSDCEIVGELHDMSIPEMILRLASHDRNLAMRIRSIYNNSINKRTEETRTLLGFDNSEGADFWSTGTGKCRVIEVWTRETREVLQVHDYKTATLRTVPLSEASSVARLQQERKRTGDAPVEYMWEVQQYWHCRWISPMGDLIAEYDSPFAHREHPYAVKMYPLTDGEVHAFVEDIIDQQKYVNRLISLIDQVMSNSAKGVLLYPTEALPFGMSWDEIRSRWNSPSGVIPFDPTSGSEPKQVSSNCSNIGAYELLSLEMKLFDEISGVAGTMRGREVSSAMGAELYKQQRQNSTVVLLDIFDTFAHFQKIRDRLITEA